MPTTRSTGTPRGRAPLAKGQSTLSFHSKVTKNVSHDAKKAIVSPSVTKIEPTPEETPIKKEIDPTEEVEEEGEEEEEKEEAGEEEEEVPEKTEAEIKAEKITNADLDKYWRSIESLRIAQRVHQGDVTRNEKILRYFDVSSHYGPCIGMTRLRRWQRAERLGLNPPIEVLAILMEGDKGEDGKEETTAHMEKVMNSIAVGSAA